MEPVTIDAGLAVLHHLLVFPLVALLVAELVLVSGPLEGPRLAQLGRIDGAYGALAGMVLLAGGARAVWGAKGWDYYAGQPMFWVKLGLFALVGLLSIGPTLRLLRWRRRGTPPDTAERQSLRRWLHAQALLLALVPVAAVLMARGIGS